MLSKEKIKELRLSKGLTGPQVAEKIGMTYPVYQAYESGARNAGLPVVEKLADFYGVTTDYLLGREPPADPLAQLGITIHDISDDEFIRRYRNLSEDGRKLFLNVMRMLTEGAVIDTDDDGIPDGFGTVTLGELEDERKRKAAENEKGGKFA